MIEVLQRLNKSSGRDRFKFAFWIAVFASVVLAPIQFVFDMVAGIVAALPLLFARSFAGAMNNRGFDDPVYKRNLQQLIERNRQFEEARTARNEPHS